MADQRLDSELNLRAIVGVGLVLVLITAVVTALMWWMSLELRSRMSDADPGPPAPSEVRSQKMPEGPLLQSDPIGEMRKMRQEEAAILEHSEWIDETAGTARLAIDTAIDIVAASGELPDLSAATPADAEGGS